MADVEIYLDNPDNPQLLDWIRQRVGPIKQVAENQDMIAFHAIAADQALPIIIQKKVEDGPFIGVWFNSIHAPWPNDKACALDAFQNLKVTVQCDPGPKVKAENAFLEINSSGEHLITLPDQ